MKTKPQLVVLHGGTVYSPTLLGKKDVLIAGGRVVHIDEEISSPKGIDIQHVDVTGKLIVPGFIDLHVHVTGGGGEGGPTSRVSEISIEDLIGAGITTVVGVLGTDAITRSPEALLAKVKELCAQGLTAYMYTGSYHLPSVTIAGSVDRDIALIEEVVGVKIAISDHRGSQPTMEELARLASLARIGGMVGKKPGIVHAHIGPGAAGLAPIIEVSQKTYIPISQFLPTHVNRSPALLQQGVAFLKSGGYIDLTAYTASDGGGITEAIETLLDSNCDLSAVTISSDGNGSMPLFDDVGKLIGMGAGSVDVLHDLFVDLVQQRVLGIPAALELFSSNPATRLGLATRKGSISLGSDADILVLDEDLRVDKVYADGEMLLDGGVPIIRDKQ